MHSKHLHWGQTFKKISEIKSKVFSGDVKSFWNPTTLFFNERELF